MRLGVAGAVVAGELVGGDVGIDGEVTAIGLAGRGTGLAIPGLVDLHVNGYAGIDVMRADPAALAAMGQALARDGVLAYQPTVITAPRDAIQRTLATIRRASAAPEGPEAKIVGAHLEGPFLAPTRAGAHPVDELQRPSLDLLAALLESGAVTMVTLAPELPGADALVRELAGRGVTVSAGHTEATAEAAAAAFAGGVTAVTHLFNAMRPFSHRDPGIVGAALTTEAVTPMLIADGVHVAPEAIRLAWRAARGRLVVVSDAMAGAGAGDGTYTLGGTEVTVGGGVARRRDGTLAGSATPLLEGLRTLVALGVPEVEAVDAVTRAPARLIGRPELGVLAPGGTADLVVLDDDLSIRAVLRGGRPVF